MYIVHVSVVGCSFGVKAKSFYPHTNTQIHCEYWMKRKRMSKTHNQLKIKLFFINFSMKENHEKQEMNIFGSHQRQKHKRTHIQKPDTTVSHRTEFFRCVECNRDRKKNFVEHNTDMVDIWCTRYTVLWGSGFCGLRYLVLSNSIISSDYNKWINYQKSTSIFSNIIIILLSPSCTMWDIEQSKNFQLNSIRRTCKWICIMHLQCMPGQTVLHCTSVCHR